MSFEKGKKVLGAILDHLSEKPEAWSKEVGTLEVPVNQMDVFEVRKLLAKDGRGDMQTLIRAFSAHLYGFRDREPDKVAYEEAMTLICKYNGHPIDARTVWRYNETWQTPQEVVRFLANILNRVAA